MALIVEDGTGLSNADSYGEIADADAYHAAMGNTLWATLTETQKEIGMRRGFQYINVNWNYQGISVSSSQSGAFPRYGMTNRDGYDLASDAVPMKVVYANFELALRGYSDTLLSDVTGNSIVKSEKVDVIAVEYRNGQSQQLSIPIVDRLLADFVVSKNGGGGVALDRAG